MRIQAFSTYLQLAKAGKAKPLACPLHLAEDGIFHLTPTMEDDKIILKCFACNYKLTAGLTLYNQVLTYLVENNEQLSAGEES